MLNIGQFLVSFFSVLLLKESCVHFVSSQFCLFCPDLLILLLGGTKPEEGWLTVNAQTQSTIARRDTPDIQRDMNDLQGLRNNSVSAIYTRSVVLLFCHVFLYAVFAFPFCATTRASARVYCQEFNSHICEVVLLTFSFSTKLLVTHLSTTRLATGPWKIHSQVLHYCMIIFQFASLFNRQW